VFTPIHGSWLNLIENRFSKMPRTMLRGIRVAGKQEPIDRIHRYFEETNAYPVVFRRKYKMETLRLHKLRVYGRRQSLAAVYGETVIF
jgi:hypothetical protein